MQKDHLRFSGPAFPTPEEGSTNGISIFDYFAAHAPAMPPKWDVGGIPAPKQPLSFDHTFGKLSNYTHKDIVEEMFFEGELYPPEEGLPEKLKPITDEIIKDIYDYNKQHDKYTEEEKEWKTQNHLSLLAAWRYQYAWAMINEREKY